MLMPTEIELTERKLCNSDSPERRRSYGSDDNDRLEADEREQEGDTAAVAATDRSDGKKRWFYSPALDVENKGSAARCVTMLRVRPASS